MSESPSLTSVRLLILDAIRDLDRKRLQGQPPYYDAPDAVVRVLAEHGFRIAKETS